MLRRVRHISILIFLSSCMVIFIPRKIFYFTSSDEEISKISTNMFYQICDHSMVYLGWLIDINIPDCSAFIEIYHFVCYMLKLSVCLVILHVSAQPLRGCVIWIYPLSHKIMSYVQYLQPQFVGPIFDRLVNNP